MFARGGGSGSGPSDPYHRRSIRETHELVFSQAELRESAPGAGGAAFWEHVRGKRSRRGDMDARGRGTRALLLALAFGLIGLAGPSSAGAAAQIGTTFPGADASCGAATVLQSTSPSGCVCARPRAG